MYRLSSIAIVLLVSIVECSVLPQQDGKFDFNLKKNINIDLFCYIQRQPVNFLIVRNLNEI